MSMTDAILKTLAAHLTAKLITEIDTDDPARAGAVKIGPLQGEPDVDVARISLELYTNDPDKPGEWADEIIEWELPRAAIWARRFTILWRALLVESGEPLSEAVDIASTVKARIEIALNTVDWSPIDVSGETVMGCPLDEMDSELRQGGGPDEYDWSGKIGFDVWTRQAYS
jgi:hypothetical protein